MIEAGRLNLEQLAETLLWESECVILPGLGGLIRRDHEASINPATHVVRPKSKSFFFNPTIPQTDGLMANYLTEKFGVSYPDAVKMIDDEVKRLKDQIAAGEKIKWASLGEFFGSADKTFFIPKTEINFDRETYGLVPIKLKLIELATEIKEVKAEAKPVIIETAPTKEAAPVSEPALDYEKTALQPELDQPIPMQAEKSNFRFIRWIAAAAVIGTILFFGIRNENKTHVTQEAAVINFDLAEEGTVENTTQYYPETDVNENDNTDKTLALETVPEEEGESEWVSEDAAAANTETIEEATPITEPTTPEVYEEPTPEVIEKPIAETTSIDEPYEEAANNAYSYDLNDQYHIVVSKTVVKSNADKMLENEQLYYLSIPNSFVHRVGIASSNQMEELENQLITIKAQFPKAEIINTKAYEKL